MDIIIYYCKSNECTFISKVAMIIYMAKDGLIFFNMVGLILAENSYINKLKYLRTRFDLKF